MKPQALAGIRVLDLTQIYQGPYATFLMAMAGAEVIKVEPPGGERTRRGGGANTPLAFAMLNSNKKSLTLDLKKPAAKELLLSMVEQADVVCENFAPGTMARLGLGWEVLRARNPRLIYGAANGYGSFGPDWDQLAMDHTIQAASGIMSITGEAGGPPARAGGQVCDFMGGIHFYGALMTALLGRERTGVGTRVESAMIEAIYFNPSSEYSHYHRTGEIPPRRGDKSAGQTAPYGRYQCSDGWVALIVVSEPQWKSLCRLIGREEWADDPAFGGPVQRYEHEDAINAAISAWTGTRSRDEAFAAMRSARLAVAPVRDVVEVMNDPHLHARGMLHRMQHPYMGDVVLPGSPLRLLDYETEALQFFPEAGADSAAVLGEWLGLDAGAVEGLRAEGVV
ncbi:MAG: CoA transferase [Alphaproteobacteria bacterium]|nr:CoA transferase [Alphaproteobacteria bacterium]MCB9930801.1 CoA transferase [Alphaproteobacteria bacterium]